MVWPDRFSSSGFAWDCLRSRMKTGTMGGFVSNNNTDGYAASLIRTGQVACEGSGAGIILSLITFLWVTLLVILHVVLSVVLTTVGAIWISNAKWVDGDKNKLVYSPNLMLAAMPVLAVGAAAEVAQHVFDNWLYLGLIPTYYLATFYAGLTLGQSLLALGVWDGPPGCWMQILPIFSVLSFILISQSGVSCTSQAREAEMLQDDQAGDSANHLSNADLAFGNCISFFPLLLAFLTLGLTTIFIFIKSKAPKPMQRQYLCTALISLIIGVGSSLVLTRTGLQWLHVPTAGGFLGLFLTELLFVRKIPEWNGVMTLPLDNNSIPPTEISKLIV
jgi:hypothetical protein